MILQFQTIHTLYLFRFFSVVLWDLRGYHFFVAKIYFGQEWY